MRAYECFISLVLLTGAGILESKPSKQVVNCNFVFELPSRDSVFLNPVYFCEDTIGEFYYNASIKTTVCNDTLCQLVLLKIYWDLAGNYCRFDTLDGRPLTKNDHIPFTASDYDMLHKTLSDETSILGDKTKDELLDKTRNRYSEKIDGVTGATALEIKSAVVDGALYSTYTLWHLVNGTIKQHIREHTLSRYDVDLEQQLLKSKNPKTIIFGLKNLDKDFYFNQFDQIVDLMRSGYPLVNFYIAKKIPEDVFTNDENIKSIQRIWNSLDRNTQSILSEYIEP